MPIAPPSPTGLDALRLPAASQVAAVRVDIARGASAAEPAFTVDATPGGRTSTGATKTAVPETFRRFEATVLQTFIQNMLPKDGAAVYGKGMAGDMWKSLLAENLAKTMAERGGIGIAERMLGQHYAAKASPAAEPANTEPSSTPAIAEPERTPLVSPAVIETMQRSLSALLGYSPPAETETAVHFTTKRG